MPRKFKQTPDIFGAKSGSKSEINLDFEPVRQSCYFAKALLARVRSYAKLNGLSASAVIAIAVQEFLARQDG